MLAATAAFTRVHSGLVLLWNFCWVSVFQLILSMPAFCKKTISYVVTTNALEEMTVLTRSYIFRKVHISLRLTLPRRICCYNIHMI